jgi:hypothetical protein
LTSEGKVSLLELRVKTVMECFPPAIRALRMEEPTEPVPWMYVSGYGCMLDWSEVRR